MVQPYRRQGPTCTAEPYEADRVMAYPPAWVTVGRTAIQLLWSSPVGLTSRLKTRSRPGSTEASLRRPGVPAGCRSGPETGRSQVQDATGWTEFGKGLGGAASSLPTCLACRGPPSVAGSRAKLTSWPGAATDLFFVQDGSHPQSGEGGSTSSAGVRGYALGQPDHHRVTPAAHGPRLPADGDRDGQDHPAR